MPRYCSRSAIEASIMALTKSQNCMRNKKLGMAKKKKKETEENSKPVKT